MIIHDGHIVGSIITPHKNNPPLTVDPDRMLTAPVATQRFEPISGRSVQVVQLHSRMQHHQLSTRRLRYRVETARPFCIEQLLGIATSKRLDQEVPPTPDYNVYRYAV